MCGARSATNSAERALGHLVDGERHITAGAVSLVRAPGVRTELGQHVLAQLARQVEHELLVLRRRPLHAHRHAL